MSTANEKKKDEKASFPTKNDKQMSNKVGGCENQPVGIMFFVVHSCGQCGARVAVRTSLNVFVRLVLQVNL